MNTFLPDNDTLSEFLALVCNIYERNVWGPYARDDHMLRTSEDARVFAATVLDVLDEAAEEHDPDARINMLLCGTRRAFDAAVLVAHPTADQTDFHFQPDEAPDDFAPCEQCGGNSQRGSHVAREIVGLIGYQRVSR
jgi:hypothetical protein